MVQSRICRINGLGSVKVRAVDSNVPLADISSQHCPSAGDPSLLSLPHPLDPPLCCC